MRLSKSDFKTASDCPSKLYLKKKGFPSLLEDHHYLHFLADGGYMVEKMAKLLYPGGIEMESWDNPEQAHAEAAALIAKRENLTLFEPTILEGKRLVRVDILNKKGKVLELIEVKSASVDMDDLEHGNPFRGKQGKILSKRKPYLAWIFHELRAKRSRGC
jgi:CRISPR/Cas system-associated exonuclease Cas4 (RecB family)